MSTILTTKKKAKSFTSMLEIYAKQEDGRKFRETAEQIDWQSYPPAALKRTIDLALALDLSRLAMDLAQKGAALFPFNQELQNAAQVLQPPTVRIVEQSPSSIAASMEWVNDNSTGYKNQWIAVRDGQLLAAAQTLKELADQTTFDTDTLVVQPTRFVGFL